MGGKRVLVKNIDTFSGTEPYMSVVVDGNVVDVVTCKNSWSVEVGT